MAIPGADWTDFEKSLFRQVVVELLDKDQVTRGIGTDDADLLAIRVAFWTKAFNSGVEAIETIRGIP